MARIAWRRKWRYCRPSRRPVKAKSASLREAPWSAARSAALDRDRRESPGQVCICSSSKAALRAALVRLGAYSAMEVQSLLRHTLSGLKPNITALPRGRVGSNGRCSTSP